MYKFTLLHICTPNFLLALTRATIVRTNAVVSMMVMLAEAIATAITMLFSSIGICVASMVKKV